MQALYQAIEACLANDSSKQPDMTISETTANMALHMTYYFQAQRNVFHKVCNIAPCCYCSTMLIIIYMPIDGPRYVQFSAGNRDTRYS